ncbi:hypothetical protein Q9233_007537 [Columba guinea]|nr:hypothetical protein Q9233_007537 [Columba guinea]
MGDPRRGGARRYRFTEGPAALALRIPEVLDSQYGMYVWPCAVVLAQYLWVHRSSLPGKRVLEIGAGVSLPGVVAAKCGAEVTLSDNFEDVLTTIYFLLEKNPHAQFWTTYQVRSADWSIEALLCKWKLKSIHVPLRSFGADKEHLGSSSLPGRHTIEMMIISLAKSDGT